MTLEQKIEQLKVCLEATYDWRLIFKWFYTLMCKMCFSFVSSSFKFNIIVEKKKEDLHKLTQSIELLLYFLASS